MELLTHLNELRDPDAHLSAAGLLRLDGLTAEEVAAFRAAWPQVQTERRRQVLRQLEELGEDNVELDFNAVYFAVLDDADPEVRQGAIRGLWEYEGRDLIDRLLRLLERDEEPEVRAEAALSLGRYVLLSEYGTLPERHHRKVEQGLRRAVEDDLEEDEVRGRALEAIGASDRPWVREAITAAHASDARRLRVSALHAMGRSCQPRWLPELVAALADDDPEIRYEAATGLGSLADRRSVSHLGAHLHDPDPEVREAVVAALGQLGGSEATALLRSLSSDPSPGIREAAAAAIAEATFAYDPLSVEHQL